MILHYHPLASFCWKVLIALYENDIPFEKVIVDLSDTGSKQKFADIWPIAKMPVLEDGLRIIPETSIIIEYLDLHHRGKIRFLPDDPDQAREVRLLDRFYDQYIQAPMQKIVGDRIRPADRRDPYGVEEARRTLKTAYSMVKPTDTFTLVDCAAAPALYYANEVEPLPAQALAYLERLKNRPSFARVLLEAEPYFKDFPRE